MGGPGGGTTGHPAVPQQISAEARGTLTEALSGWRDKYPIVRVRQDIVHGHPARVLASYTARADLVVIGSGPGTGPGIGSIRHAVLNHAAGPVAVIPSGD
jgi:nucleotide-binding universal stress UspA family protein